MKPAFSVILPLRNVAPWLPECLASLRAQTWRDWEGLCVDDGSADASGGLLVEALRADARLHALFQPPSGVSRARNRGLARARGDAIAFLDGDDTVASWWLEDGLRLMQATNADLVHFEFSTRPMDGAPHHERRGGRHWVLTTPREIHRWGWPAFVYNGYNWLLLVRRALAQRIRYVDSLHIKEDCVYALDLLPALARVCLTESAPYCYRQRKGSALCSTWSVEEPLRLFAEARRLLHRPLPPEATAVRKGALAVFVLQALVDWGSRSRRVERWRFNEVRKAFAGFVPEVFAFREVVRPHWRPSVGLFLKFGWIWPMRAHGFVFRTFVRIKWQLFGAPSEVYAPPTHQVD